MPTADPREVGALIQDVLTDENIGEHFLLPEGYRTIEDAVAMGYIVNEATACNCGECREDRMKAGLQTFINKYRQGENHFKFISPINITAGNSMRLDASSLPKADGRFKVKIYDLVYVKRFTTEPNYRNPSTILFSTNSFIEIMAKNCQVCGENMHSITCGPVSRWTRKRAYLMPNGKPICDRCMRQSEDYFYCSSCDTLYETENVDSVDLDNDSENPKICQDCYDEHYCTCDDCGGTVSNDDVHNVGDSYYCDECYERAYFYCRCCESDCNRDDSHETDDGPVCDDCFEEHYSQCQTCSRVCNTSRGSFNDDGEFTCRTCIRDGAIVHSHSYKPRPQFRMAKGEKREGNLFYGFELEMENVMNVNEHDKVLDYTNQHFKKVGGDAEKLIYWKGDGSLMNGMEAVSHPMSWAWFNAHRKDFSQWLYHLREMGWRSYNTRTCGLHIHMNKSALNGVRLYKYLMMFYENPLFIYQISGRKTRDDFNQWAAVDSEGSIKQNIAYEVKHKKKQKFGRYWALNMENSDTIECRIFKGTLREGSFFRAFEFLQALYDFCENGRYSVTATTLANFKAFVFSDNGKTYPHLNTKMRAMSDKSIEAEDINAPTPQEVREIPIITEEGRD